MIGLNLGHWYLLKLAASKCPNSRKSSFRTWGQGDLLSAITDWQIFWGWLVNFESNLYRLLRPKILKNAKIKAFDTWKRHIRADFSKIRNCQIPPFARFLCQIVHRAAAAMTNRYMIKLRHFWKKTRPSGLPRFVLYSASLAAWFT